jgi:uncharacterized coiled-coil protein SlyX
MTLYGPTDSKFDPMVELLRARIDRLQAAISVDDRVIERLNDDKARLQMEVKRLKGAKDATV